MPYVLNTVKDYKPQPIINTSQNNNNGTINTSAPENHDININNQTDNANNNNLEGYPDTPNNFPEEIEWRDLLIINITSILKEMGVLVSLISIIMLIDI